MEWLAALLVQLAVGVLTLSISLELTPAHFAAAARARRDLTVGLLAQLAIVPALVLLLVTVVPLAPAVAIALCLVAFTPSGPTSNYLAHLAGGDTALAFLLTVAGTLLSAAAMPLAVPALLQAVTGGAGVAVATPLAVFTSLLWMVVVPLVAGLLAARHFPTAVRRLLPPLRRVAAALFVLLLAAAIGSQWRVLAGAAATAALPVLAINVAALALGALVGRAAGLARPQRLTLALKAGVQNISIALGIAIGVLGRLDVAAVAALYGITQLLVATAYALLAKRQVAPTNAQAG
jgi:BASS family bile acid:Na+ symporter